MQQMMEKKRDEILLLFVLMQERQNLVENVPATVSHSYKEQTTGN
jgi:hypothetical protein